MTDGERIAALEEAARNTEKRLDSIASDVKAILATLASMSGGRKALLGLCAIMGTVLGGIGTLIGAIASGFVHR